MVLTHLSDHTMSFPQFCWLVWVLTTSGVRVLGSLASYPCIPLSPIPVPRCDEGHELPVGMYLYLMEVLMCVCCSFVNMMWNARYHVKRCWCMVEFSPAGSIQLLVVSSASRLAGLLCDHHYPCTPFCRLFQWYSQGQCPSTLFVEWQEDSHFLSHSIEGHSEPVTVISLLHQTVLSFTFTFPPHTWSSQTIVEVRIKKGTKAVSFHPIISFFFSFFLFLFSLLLSLSFFFVFHYLFISHFVSSFFVFSISLFLLIFLCLKLFNSVSFSLFSFFFGVIFISVFFFHSVHPFFMFCFFLVFFVSSFSPRPSLSICVLMWKGKGTWVGVAALLVFMSLQDGMGIRAP